MNNVQSVLQKSRSLAQAIEMISPMDFQRICEAAQLGQNALFERPAGSRNIDVSTAIGILSLAASYAGLALRVWELIRKEQNRDDAERLKERVDKELPEHSHLAQSTRIEICVAIVVRCESH